MGELIRTHNKLVAKIILIVGLNLFGVGAGIAVSSEARVNGGLICMGVAILLIGLACLLIKAASGYGKLAIVINGTVLLVSLATSLALLIATIFFFAPKRNVGAAVESGSYGNELEGAGVAPVKRGVKPEPDAEAAVVDTNFGKIVIELYPNVAPRMVERFKTLARQGFYNGTTFHRINAEVIQGGDPLSKDDNPANDGTGDSPLPNVPAEFSDIPFDRGVVGAARKGSDVDSANCQFYITLQRVPDWDEQYTAFGRVVEGMSNAQIIAGAPRRPGSESPADKIVINSITLQPRASFVR